MPTTPRQTKSRTLLRRLCLSLCLLGSTPAIAAELEQYLGYPLGEWHIRHDQINGYLQQLASSNPKVSLEQTGYSHERRQQLTAVITSEQNQQRLKEILAARLEVKSGNAKDDVLVVWLAYSIHGDEASGAHAAMALIEQLATSQEPWITDLLANTVVLVTPSQNPDGLDRFANWSNSYRGIGVATSDNNHKEHNQNWPSGRFNHYLADLNRDWLFLRHPESRGRVALLHKWQPHYVGDFHEMGHDETYFFQPGVPSRTHPLTAKKNQELTEKLADFYREALDQKQQPYFSRQSFDDFFYGKGSTYPDINGAVGVLFEQASARGQMQDSSHGGISLAKAIDNQLTTSLAALRGTHALRQELMAYQKAFYADKQGSDDSGRLINTQGDPQRRDALAEVLTQHGIHFAYLQQTIKSDKQIYTPNDSLFIPNKQSQSLLLQAMFERRTRFADSTFYDVSAWDFGSALNLTVTDDFAPDSEALSQTKPAKQPKALPESTVAVLIDWRQGAAAKVLAALHQQDIRVRVATRAFTPRGGEREFGPGTLMVATGQQPLGRSELLALLTELADKSQLELFPVSSFSASSGIDLGSANMAPLARVKPLLISGRGTDTTEVGEIWQLLDSGLNQPYTLADMDNLERFDLSGYTHVLFADGNYSELGEAFGRKLGEFVKAGGVVIAQKGALSWLAKHDLLRTAVQDASFYQKEFDTKALKFADRDALKARQTIGGAVVSWQLDNSHPLAYGIGTEQLPVMKDKVIALAASEDAFTVAAYYAQKPLLAGFLADEYQQALGLGNALVAETKGKGVVVAMADNLLFRNIWLSGAKVYSNALYLLPAAMEP
ncbi:peptidase M14 [Shewanella sp. JM162201]|uniref:Peptidase M14 n=2 Tax=Shewanella jiangmenensis TaxID=2837387 RepID=A0ABS5V3Z8_9GAMM|nr:peptidase M14 [Shewanella jiangmenensis]